MKHIFYASGLLVVILSLVAASSPTRKRATYTSYFENVLGTSFQIKTTATSEEAAAIADDVALDEVERLSKILSAYDPSSEFSRWQKTLDVNVSVSNELFDVLRLFDAWRIRTHGALDPSAEVVSRLWREAARKQQLPTQRELSATTQITQQMHWKLNPDNKTAMRTSDAPLMLNTFVKSYIINKATEAVRKSPGITAVVINIGGDIVTSGDSDEVVNISNPKADAENDPPLAQLRLCNLAVATSGNYRRGVEINGQWYSHIVDPRTGKPARDIISATVIAPHAEDAGALATAFNVLTLDESRALAATVQGAEYLIVTRQGEHIYNAGFQNLQLKSTCRETTNLSGATEKKVDKIAKKEYELLINLELSKFEGRSRRPFLAIWVENNKKKTVRTVALWYSKTRWLPELKQWHHGNYTNYTEGGSMNMATISSATRPAGKYTIKWDMKDDQGEAVKSGKYTLYIEAAREHGTYQLIKQEIECKNKPQQITLPGNVEIAEASLDYREKIESEQ